ncbi:MAG: class I SAM-dependent methyltransferase [Ruminococcus sp.]|nr:class I SAM-dependent methyltransferase [Ruminococcus sp.]
MSISEQFNLIAKEYDINRKRFIPCFDDFYISTTNFLTANITTPERILDLGAGTGLLSAFWLQHFPKAEYVLVDIADEMLEVAKERFNGLNNISYQNLDYSKGFPDYDFDVIISALSVHHLDNENKAELFESIYNKLPQGGLFINYDQFCADSEQMSMWFNTYWEGQLKNSGLTDADIKLWYERRKLDRECSAEEEINMLKECNFSEVNLIYSNQKFSVIAAVK